MPRNSRRAAPERRRAGRIARILLILLIAGPAAGLVAQDQEGGTSTAGSAASEIARTAGALFEQQDLTLAVKIVLVMSVLTLLPALFLTMTSFTRVMVILSFVKRAMGVQELPPHQVVVGFALFLTLAIMAPVFAKINTDAIEPYRQEKITLSEAGGIASEVMGAWLLNQTRPADIQLMVHIARVEPPARPDATPLYILIPAFALSELKTSFQMGFVIFLPFLVIDIVIASILLSMGMFMLPPVIISTPFKIILFVLVDGWTLVISSLVRSFGA